MLAKTVVLRGPKGFAMAVLPADCKADLEELERALKQHPLRLATEEQVRTIFSDSEVGAVPPFGNLFGLPVYMDVRLADETYIFFNAGTHRDAIHMSSSDYIGLTDPVIIRFAVPDNRPAVANGAMRS
jgi:Ala-tRNA(Pro) deacylase